MIERLRALEKKFQEEATVARDTFKYGGGEYYDGRRDAFNLAADELATLIAELGQEVGAVAWQYRKPGGRWETVSKSTFDKYREGSGYEWRELFTTTGQTSGARDAELWRFCNGTHELENGEVAKMHVNVGVNVWRGENWLAYHECSPDEAREVINGIAAMRQEAGDEG